MPGISLCGELQSFAHDQDLLGFCPDNPDDPAGDSFHERCRFKLVGRWFDSRDPKGEIHLESDDEHDAQLCKEGDEDSTEVEIEFQGEYAYFCAMSFRQQAVYMATMRAKICALIGVSSLDWEPSDAFILDAIQDETPNDVLKEMAYAAYLATPAVYEFNPSDVEPELPLDDDCIRVSQQGSSGKSDRPQDFDLDRSYLTRSKESNSRKKKCWHSHRRVTIRRDSEFYFEDHVDTFGIFSEISEFNGSEREFITVKAKLLICLDDSLTNEQLEWLDDINHGRYDYEPKAFNIRLRRSSYDFFDVACTCRTCMGDWNDYADYSDDYYQEPTEIERLIDGFADSGLADERDDIFVGYGETDADIDCIFPRFSSGGRFSYRFRGLSKRQQEALRR